MEIRIGEIRLMRCVEQSNCQSTLLWILKSSMTVKSTLLLGKVQHPSRFYISYSSNYLGAIDSVKFLQHVLADVWVCRASEVGTNEVHTRTHLGHLLKPGDVVMG